MLFILRYRNVPKAATHCEVHEVEELLQHFCHDGEISFWQVFSHSSHIHLVETNTAVINHRNYTSVSEMCGATQ